MVNIFSNIEGRLQGLVEGLAKLFPDRNPVHELIQKLVQCMRTHLVTNDDQKHYAPGKYHILLSPEEETILQQKKDWLTELETALKQVALENDIIFLEPLEFKTVARDPNLNGIIVECQKPIQEVEDTAAMSVSVKSARESHRSTFFLIDGKTTFTIRELVVNIGRRSDNQLIIDDPRVSRLHAQLRTSFGETILFDLNSTGGTLVNGKRIDQIRLHPGDVISLAGFPLIYGEEIETPTMDDPSSDNPTVLPKPGTS